MDEVGVAWYKSKKLVALITNHTIVLFLAAFGIFKQPDSTGQIIVGSLAELGPVTAAHMTSQSYVDGAKAKSPYYTTPGAPPNPPPPITIPSSVTSVTITPAAADGAASVQITPPKGTTPSVPIKMPIDVD